MYLFNQITKLIVLILILGSFARAQDADPRIEEENTFTKETSGKDHQWLINFGYVSWEEQLTVNSATASDWGVANFSGNLISIDRESYFSTAPHHGVIYEAGLLYGVVDAQDKGGLLTYSVANISYSAEEISYRYLYRFTSKVAMSVGPILMARQVTLGSVGNGTSATSGNNFNYGAIFDARATLFPKFDFIMTGGTLLSNASTLWGLSIGYLF